MSFNVDIIIILGFLMITLAVGMVYGKNVKTIQDYALGGRNFKISSIVAGQSH